MAIEPEEILKSADSHTAYFLRELFAGHFRDDTSINPRNPRPKKPKKKAEKRGEQHVGRMIFK